MMLVRVVLVRVDVSDLPWRSSRGRSSAHFTGFVVWAVCQHPRGLSNLQGSVGVADLGGRRRVAGH